MLNRRTQENPINISTVKSIDSYQNRNHQYGLSSASILLGIPAESLTHITSYLDLSSLLALARVNNRLYQHVKDDNTWHGAFLCQFLGIGPESDPYKRKHIMLRRLERSWKNEFIVRCNLKRRWERSRNTTIAHTPLHSSISTMHLMPSDSLLTSSLQYGIVSRSFPLTGKVLRGYLDASGTGIGLGIGNPNAEFTPNISACALASDGGTAKIIWGYHHGEVAVMTAHKAMDAGAKTAAKLVRCKVDEEHEGAVLAAVWDDGGSSTMVTGGADGRVKIWDTKNVRCVWTSDRKDGTLIPDACVKIAAALEKGFIVGVMKSCELVIWIGFDLESLDKCSVKEIRIPSPIVTPHDSEKSTASHNVTALYVDFTAPSPTFLVAYQDHPCFYRVHVDVNTTSAKYTIFGDKSFGFITSAKPCFSGEIGESSFVITGDHLGCVSIYNWTDASLPDRKFDAHQDGSSVTALAWNDVTLITGSAHGAVHVWDALTFEHIRSFGSPLSRHRGSRMHGANEPVSQILVGPERESFSASVGERVTAWRAGPVARNGKGASRVQNGIPGIGGRRKGEKRRIAKYNQRLETQKTVAESRDLFEQESGSVNRTYKRATDQRIGLERLGLDEVEAVEYVLMLSRDEALERADPRVGPEAGGSMEGVFEGDFDDFSSTTTADNGQANKIPSEISPSRCSSSSSLSSSRCSSINIHQADRKISGTSPTFSNQKVQVSPRLRREATEAGFGPPASSPAAQTPAIPIPADRSHFPPISAGASPGNLGNSNASSKIAAESPVRAGCSHPRHPVSSSPKSVKFMSAWSTPLVKSSASSPETSVPGPNRSPASRSSNDMTCATSKRPLLQWGSRSENRTVRDNGRDEEMDDELRLAIRLSLAEAKSQGGDI